MHAPYRFAVVSTMLALLPLSLTAGCGGAAKDAGASTSPALTRDQAQAVLTAYEAANARANAVLDPALLATVETGPQLQMDTAAYKLHVASKTKLAPFSFTDPKFYIPRASGHPRWFAVDTESAAHGSRIQHALLFRQDAAGAAWKLTADPQRRDGGPINGLALDSEGYAQTADDASPALPPGRLAEAHAALLGGGPTAPTAAGLAAGPQTTGTYTLLQQIKRELAQHKLAFSTAFTAVPEQTYALRTADGGAVVWYVLQQEESYKGAQVPVTGDLVGLVPQGKAKTLDSTTLIQYLAAIPAKGDATVTGASRKAVAAQVS
jgi:hypothetical protein